MSEYTDYVKDCLIGENKDKTQPEKMKTCAGKWRKKKGLPDPPPKKDKDTDCESILLMSMGGCPTCKEVKEVFKDEIKAGDIQVMDIFKEGKEIAKELKIKDVPAFVCKKKRGAPKKVKGGKIAKHFKKEGYY
ncbi:hypothetical protein LCGC14_0926570 [marine sediment metagenome]|uniref:Thioredoxin-like fold domain-containing protein n=1 Tax=marine sediment metagenome TaxID=412755 RepID=A0A0F9NPC8_9ZZZZ